MVKTKSGILQIFTNRHRTVVVSILPVLSLLTFFASWAGLYPPRIVERWYARLIFPKLSEIAGQFADAVSFSWLDVVIPLAVLALGFVLFKRQWKWILNFFAVLYLIFFWAWGLNYHRQPLNSKLQVDSARMQPEPMTEFAKHVARELNRLYPEKEKLSYDEAQTQSEAVRRIRRVVAVIDGSDWQAAHRIKMTRIGNPWFHAAGIDGMFNPFGHEPLIDSTLLDIERPFVIAHELAHVRGYPDEGDANVIATFATLMSDSPAFQYSGWLNLWFYVRTRELDSLIDAGPRGDIQRIYDRERQEQIRWINDLQRTILDWFLKANNIEEGVRSYSRVALVAAGTEPTWERFR
jgi:uncharacterized membrane protein